MTRITTIALSLIVAASASAAETFAPSVAGYTTQSTNPLVMGGYYTYLWRVGDYAKNYVHVGFLFFDLNAYPELLVPNRKVGLSLKLNNITGTPAPMRIDFIGTFSDTTLNQGRYSSASIFSLPSVMTMSSSPGIYTYDVSRLHQFQLPNRFAVFRLYQENYISKNSITDCYNLGQGLTASWLHTIPDIKLSIRHDTENVFIGFSGVGQFSYKLEESPDMGGWTVRGSTLQGTNQLIEVLVPRGGANAMFYRVGIIKSP